MTEALRREGARGPWLGLLRELATLAGTDVQFVRHAERPWSTATFAGARHSFTLTFAGADAVAAGENLIAELPEHEFTLNGRLVADAKVVAAEHSLIDGPRLTIEAELLVLDEA
jgi:hypothetical protein